jgi:hypothetical protein
MLQAEDDGASFATAAPAGRGKAGVSEYGESFAVRLILPLCCSLPMPNLPAVQHAQSS